ncbi:MAG: glycoside hydrolase family 16 protein [Lentisphaerae bacterium]|jgi:beta-glucanase (GH16 family)|nr:glycoside hydrolase family 16 protein [Lentisphaerota bacterium]
MNNEATIKTAAVKDHEPSLLPAGKKWKLVWNDEFDGTELDRTKWAFRTHFWGKRFPAFADDGEGVVLDGKGNVELHLLKKGDQYCSPQLQTGANTFDTWATDAKNPWGQASIWPFAPIRKPGFMHRYGYYEVRCKFQRSDGWWSAFWLQSPSIGTSYNPAFSGVECDIMECFKPAELLATSGNIYGGYGPDYRNCARVNYNFEETPDKFHRFGVDWSPDGYVFYCDGKVVSRQTPEDGPVSRVEQFILLTTEPQGYRNKVSAPSDALRATVLPDCFTVDYVRVFDEVAES